MLNGVGAWGRKLAGSASLPAACCLLAIAAAPASAGGPCPECTGAYSGSWTMEYKLKNPGIEVGEPEFKRFALALKWNATLSWNRAAGTNEWRLTAAEGNLSISGTGSKKEDCTATLSPGPDAVTPEAIWGVTYGEYDAGGRQVGWTVGVAPPAEWGPGYPQPLKSSSAGGACASGPAGVYGLAGPFSAGVSGGECHYVLASAGIQQNTFPLGSSHTVVEKCLGEATLGSNRWKGELFTTTRFASPGVVSPGSGGPAGGGSGAVYGPWFPKAKEDAEEAMRTTVIPNAMRYCLPFASGLGLLGAGVLVGALPGGLAGTMLAMSGGLTAAALGPFCGPTLSRLVELYKAWKDPPLSSIGVVARPTAAAAPALPSCSPFKGRVGAACVRLRSAWASLDASTQTLAGIAKALQETVGRERAAGLAGQQSAVGAQDANLKVLLAEEAAAERREAAAGRAVRAAYASAGLRFLLTKKNSARAIAFAERRASRLGVPASRLAGLAPSAVRPAARDLRAGLGGL